MTYSNKYIFRLRLFILVFFSVIVSISAQLEPIQIQLLISPPYPTQLSEYKEKSDELIILITNSDPSKSYDFRISGSIEGDNGISFVLPESYIPARPLQIGPGEFQSLSLSDLGDYYPNLTEDDLIYQGSPSLKYLVQSQRVPDGSYTICMRAWAYKTGVALSARAPRGCSNPITVRTLEPPVIITPQDGDEVDRSFPQMINFTWTPVIGFNGLISYDFIIAEIPEGVNPYDAIESMNLRIYSEQDLLAPIFIYDEALPPLIDGKEYAIRVTARDESNSIAIRNEGKSAVVRFTYSEDNDGSNRQYVDRPQANFDCLAECLPIDFPDMPDLSDLLPGDTIRIGHFDLEIIDAQKIGNTFSGSGVIKASVFIPFDISTQFEDLQINSGGFVKGGQAVATKKAAVEGLRQLDNYNGDNQQDEEDLDLVFNTILDPETTVSTLIGEGAQDLAEAVGLPIAFGEGDIKIHITDLVFTPEGAIGKLVSGYKMLGDYIDQYQNMVFRNGAVCITPGGLGVSGDDLKMELVNETSYHPSDAYTIHFPTGGAADNGSWINFDCDGIDEIHVNGYTAFSRDYILPENGNGTVYANDQLALGFSANFTSWDEMVMSFNAESNRNVPGMRFTSDFQLPQLSDFTFTMDEIIMDVSESNNHNDISFPNGYDADETWQGFYAGQIQVKFPSFFESNGERATATIDGLIIDEGGITTSIKANNIISGDDGKLGGWGFTMDKVDIQILRSELEKGDFEGKIRVPIAENPLEYEAEINYIDDETDYRFQISLGDDIDVPMWYCSLTLDERSSITARIDDGEVDLEATFHGQLNFDNEIGDWGEVDIQNLAFENLTISNHEPYLSAVDFDLNTNMDAEFMGFKIALKNIELLERDVRDARNGINSAISTLSLGLEFEFGGEENNFTTDETQLLISGIQDLGDFTWSPHNLELGAIGIGAEMSAVEIHGRIEEFTNDATYGNGFKGDLDATFLGDIEMRATVLFGNTDFDYWYVDGGVRFGSGISIAPPMELLGFSGGAYYNMNPRENGGLEVGIKNNKPAYEPRRGGFGFKAGTVMGVSPDPDLVNGTMGLEVSFGRGGSLNSIQLDGSAQMIASPSYSMGQSGGAIQLAGRVTYNHTEGVLDGNLGYLLNAGPITGGDLSRRVINYHFAGLNSWHVYIGSPSEDGGFGDMVDFRLGIPMRMCGDNVNLELAAYAYFTIGSSIPPMPPFPAEVLEFTGPMRMSGSHNVAGVGFGLHSKFDMPRVEFSVWGCGVGFRAGAGLGFDAHLGKYDGFTCNGNANFGINNWYATGQAYVYGDAKFNGKIFGKRFNILEAGFGAIVRIEAPNPIFVGGRIGARIRLPIYGAYRFNRGFRIGTQCDLDVDEEAARERLEEEASELVMITDISVSQAEDVNILDRNFSVDVDFFKNPDQINRFESGNQVLSYRIKYEFDLFELNGARIRRVMPSEEIHHYVLRGRSKLKIFSHDAETANPILTPGKRYRVVVRAQLETHDGHCCDRDFRVLQREDGSVVREEKQIEFTTLGWDNPQIQDVIKVIPAANQKYFHPSDHYNGEGYINYGERGLINVFGNRATVKVRYTDLATGNNFETPARRTIRQNDEQLVYRVANLRENKNYRMDIIVDAPGQNATIIYTQTFHTSHYRQLREKVEAMDARLIKQGSTRRGQKNYILEFEGLEPFDPEFEPYEISYITQFGRDISAWHNYRTRIEEEVQNCNVVGIFMNEFVDLNQQNRNVNNPYNLGGGINLGRINLGGIGNNNNNNNQQSTYALRYRWLPNDYLKSLYTQAKDNACINSKKLNENIFSVPYRAIQESDVVGFKIRVRHKQRFLEKSFSLRF